EMQYMRSLNLRTESTSAMSGLLKGLDALLMPTTLIVAPKVEEALGKETGELRSMLLRNTELFNMSGLPALSMPMQRRHSLLPTGLQVVGGPGSDAVVLGVAEMAWSVLHA
ncbi:MAG: amidase family protein, partial [Thaumarchaeota archaeon]|nr:amidase family protein [Nitrososphaerota archaeon]